MFSEDEKKIFGPYFNGKGNVYADPLKVYRVLQRELGGEVNKYLEKITSEDEMERLSAEEKLAAASYAAFELDRFSPETGQGIPELAALRIFKSYVDFMQEKKS